jgi:hypothetical protein
MARISSVRKPTFDLKAPLCRPSRQAVGRRRQLLYSHDHEVLLGRKASKDLLVTHHKKELEGYRHLGRTVDQRLQVRVLLQALLLWIARGNDGSNSNSSNKKSDPNNHNSHSRRHTGSCRLFSLPRIASNLPSPNSRRWKLHNRAEAFLSAHVPMIASLKLHRVERHLQV